MDCAADARPAVPVTGEGGAAGRRPAASRPGAHVCTVIARHEVITQVIAGNGFGMDRAGRDDPGPVRRYTHGRREHGGCPS